jgi:dihydrofolate reductase
MGKLGVFNNVTVDGFFAGPNGELDWFKAIEKDSEFDAFTHEGASGGSTLVFGRMTYQMMKSYWPTPMAEKSDPVMTKVMRDSPKIVFSRTLKAQPDEPTWKHVTVLRAIDPAEIRRLKETMDLTILGSGNVTAQLTDLGLIDEYMFAVAPIVIGKGKTLFQNVKETGLKLQDARGFANGVTLLRYAAAT